MHLDSFYVDKYPVTNAEFKKFLDATRYQPKDAANFLRDWKDGTYPTGWENKPVTWVSQEDARAYARWAGKRLPHEWEWQYAAQGPDARLYPWEVTIGTTTLSRLPTNHAPCEVRIRSMHIPKGASPFGVMDMVGNVWQRGTRSLPTSTLAPLFSAVAATISRMAQSGTSPKPTSLPSTASLLLMSPSMDRSAAIGFRCVVDAQ